MGGQLRLCYAICVSHQIMKPIYRGIIVVWKTFPNRGTRKCLLILANVRGYYRLRILLLLYRTQSPVIGNMIEQLCPLSSLFEVLRHALTATEVLRSGER